MALPDQADPRGRNRDRQHGPGELEIEPAAARPCGGGAGNGPQDRAGPDGRRGAEPLAALVRLHLVGPPGTGKSHLSLALGIEAVKAGRSVYFTTLADLVGALAKAEREGTPSSRSDLFDKRAPPVATSLGFSSTVALE